MSTSVKKVTKKVVKKPSAHPAYGDMVRKAVMEMKDRKGSSRQAIIKYIRANFKISATENVESYVRRSLVAAIKAGRLIHTKGAGASGSFKLPEKEKKAKKTPVKKAKKSTTPKKKRTPKKAKKVAAPAASGDAAAKPKKSKTPKKAKKSPAKKVTKKVKTPKRAGAKKVAPKKKMSAKKAVKK